MATDNMKKYIVQYWPTTTSAQPPLMSRTDKTPDYVYQFETEDLEEAKKVAKRETEVSDLMKIEELAYDPTDKEFNENATWVEILETDEDGELIGEIEFDSPTYWIENRL